MKPLKATIFAALSIITLISLVFAQNKPFPQAVDHPNCIKPNVDQSSMNSDVKTFYNTWKNNYLKESEKTTNGYYIESGGTGTTEKTTITEAHGWGMIVFALMAGSDGDPNAKKYFDGMHYFAKDHPSSENKALMSWQVLKGESTEADASATDGDFDMAYAYILAHDQWGSDGDIDYLQEARNMIINGLLVSDINKNTNWISLGDFVNNLDPTSEFYWATRPSDWMGDHLRAFSYNTGSSKLAEAADHFYTIYNQFTSAYSPNTGLVSDFIVKETPEPAPKNYLYEYVDTDIYKWNACRVPWRIATDYAHWGTENAKTMCNKMLGWVKGACNNNPASISAGYELDGTAVGAGGDPAFIAPFVAACIVDPSHQSFLNDGWDEIRLNYTGGVYQNTINLLCQLLISGNWWKAEGEEPVVDTSGVIFDSFNNDYTDGNSQTYLGAAYGYALTEDVNKVDTGGAFWYVYCDSLGSKIECNGFPITNDNINDMFNAKDGYVMASLITSTSTDIYSYAGMGSLILGIEDYVYHDFSNMTGMTIKVKGEGTIRVALITADIFEYPVDSMRWGFYGFNLPLEADWKSHTIDTSLFKPEQWSIAAENEWTWHHKGAKDSVTQIEIATSKSGEDVKNLCIDYIIFNGLQYERDFGFKYIPPNLTKIKGLVKKENGIPCKVVPDIGSKSITVSYTMLREGDITISMYDMAGKRLGTPVTFHGTKGNYTRKISLGSIKSNGIYVLRFDAGNDVYYTKVSLLK